MSDEQFDPYWQWLRIPPHERPVDHYRLLGLAPFESDVGKIERAADERMNLVRSFQSGPRVAFTQKLLNELSAARLCLLNVQSKASYDAVLRGRIALGATSFAPSVVPSVAPQGMPAPPAVPIPSLPVGWQQATTPSAAPVAYPGVPTAIPVAMPYGAPTGVPSNAPLAAPVALPYHAGSFPGPVPPAVPVALPYSPPASVPETAPPPAYPPLPPTPPPIVGTVAVPDGRADDSFDEEPRAEETASPSLFQSNWFYGVLIVLLLGGTALIVVIVRGKDAAEMASNSSETAEVQPPSVEGAESAAGSSSNAPDSTVAGPLGRRRSRANPRRETHSEDALEGPVVILQEATGEVHLAAQTAELFGDHLALVTEGDRQLIQGWGPPDETLVWNFKIFRPDVFRVELTYAATDNARGGRIAFRVDEDEIKVGQVVATGGLDKFRTDIFHIPVRRNGNHEFSFTVLDLPTGGSFVFQSLRLIPKGLSGD